MCFGPWCGFALFRDTGRISDRSLWGSFLQFLPSPPAPLGKGFSFVQQACPCKRVSATYIIITKYKQRVGTRAKTMNSIILTYCYCIISYYGFLSFFAIFERICCRWMFPLRELFPLWSCHIDFVHFEIGVLLVQKPVFIFSWISFLILASTRWTQFIWLVFSQYWLGSRLDAEGFNLCRHCRARMTVFVFPLLPIREKCCKQMQKAEKMHSMSCADDQAVQY